MGNSDGNGTCEKWKIRATVRQYRTFAPPLRERDFGEELLRGENKGDGRKHRGRDSLIALSRELEALRQSVKRSAPYGSASWVQRTAQRLNLQRTLRPRGRPQVRPIAKQ
jgi:hypothetical protein